MNSFLDHLLQSKFLPITEIRSLLFKCSSQLLYLWTVPREKENHEDEQAKQKAPSSPQTTFWHRLLKKKKLQSRGMSKIH